MVTSRNALRTHISRFYPRARITRHPTDTNCLIAYNLDPAPADKLLYGCTSFGDGYLFRLHTPNIIKAPKPLSTDIRRFRAYIQEHNLDCIEQPGVSDTGAMLYTTAPTLFSYYSINAVDPEHWVKQGMKTVNWQLFRFSTEKYCLQPEDATTEGKTLINPGLNPCGTRTRSDGLEYIYIAVSLKGYKSLKQTQSARLTCAMKHFSNAYLLLSNILYNNFDLEEAKVLFEGYSKQWNEVIGTLTGEELGTVATKFSNGVETITL